MSYERLIAGRVVLPDGVMENGWIAVTGGVIAAIGQGTRPNASQVQDYGQSYIFPGVVDGQTHAGSCRGLPGIESTTRSAIAGGVTTIVDMPYDNPEPLNSAERLGLKVEAISRLAHCDVALYGTIAPLQPATDALELIAGGCCAIKISAFESHPTRFPRINSAQMLDLFEVLAPTDIPLGIHNEDQEIVRERIARKRAQGLETIADHSDSRPEAAELACSAHFLELGAATGAHAHLVHLSSPRGFQLVERYAEEGYRATGELCVHYLSFDPDQDGPALGAKMKVSPPIRPKMKAKLWEEVRAGRVDFISSDHSSWPIDGKLTPSIYDAGAGVPGLETLLPAMLTGAKENLDDPITQSAWLLAEAPARFFGLFPQKGAIRIGSDADLAVIEEGAFVWDASQAHDELCWSPYDGATFTARVKATYLRGALAFQDGVVLNLAGSGQFVARQSPSEPQ